jgi:hypothetical protein
MTNKNALIILIHAKEKEKWVPITSLKRVGLQPRQVELLEDRGILVSKYTAGIGKTVILTLEGYKTAKNTIQNMEEI